MKYQLTIVLPQGARYQTKWLDAKRPEATTMAKMLNSVESVSWYGFTQEDGKTITIPGDVLRQSVFELQHKEE